jgi:nucleoside-triphosphatase THEP1
LLDERGAKTGIEMVDLTTGKRQTFARIAPNGVAATIGGYRLVDEAVEWARGVMAAALLANVDWLVIDEIGPLELHQNQGFAFALEPLADPHRVPNAIVIVRDSLVEELAERLGRPDMVRLLVTEANRGSIPGELVELIRAAK